MVMILSDSYDLDFVKLLKMVTIHDIAESMVGDITPHNGLSIQEKIHKETEGINRLFNSIPDRQDYLDLWKEYVAQKGKEAKLVKDLDKLEMAISAMEYQDRYPDLDLSEFIKGVESQIADPIVNDLLKHLRKQGIATSQ
jgi:5'-deoxynucleotidase YfbR-like HD superfamily hydrolase